MKIAIRIDDVSLDMDWEKFLRFKKILDDNNIKPLIGVVPENRDQMLKDFATPVSLSVVRCSDTNDDDGSEPDGMIAAFWKYIKSLLDDGYVAAMHGVNHVYTTKNGGVFPLNHLSEFSGLSYEEQYELLRYGKEVLEQKGIDTDIFMAPAHSFDKNTLKALKALGFTRITDGFGKAPYEYSDMTFYPISFLKSKTLKSNSNGFSTLVFHPNTMSDNDFAGFEDMIRENKGKFISYSDYLDVPKVKRGVAGRVAENMLAKFKRFMAGN